MGRLQGHLDRATGTSIDGWAFDAETPNSPVELELLIGDSVLARFVASRYREDLAKAGFGSGCCAFSLQLPPGWAASGDLLISVRRASDGTVLGGSPVLTEAPVDAETRMRQTIQHLITIIGADHAGDGGVDYDALLELLVNSAEKMLRAGADQGQPSSVDIDAFYDRWQPLLKSAQRPVLRQLMDRPAELRKRALFIQDAMPSPWLAMVQPALTGHMASVARLGYQVSFVPTTLKRELPGQAALEAAGIECYLSPFFASVEEVFRRYSGMFDMIYISGRDVFLQYAHMARTYMPRAKLIYGVPTLEHLYLSRRGAVDELSELLRRSRNTRASETMAVSLADTVITSSTYDATVLEKDVPRARIEAIAWPCNAIPVEKSFNERHGIAFLAVGSRDAARDAIHWLSTSILPRLRLKKPGIPCVVLCESAESADMACNEDDIVFAHGADAFKAALQNVRLTMAPLRYGAGLHGAVLVSLGSGLPCVCSPVAAEGLALPDLLEGCVGSTPQRLVDIAVRLHEDESYNQACAAVGSTFIQKEFSVDVIDQKMKVVLGNPSK